MTGDAAGRRVGAGPARAGRPAAWSGSASRRSSTATRSGRRWRRCSPATPWCCVPQFDPHEIWRDVERHKVNVMVLIGDAMARPIIEAFAEGDYDALVAVWPSPAARRCSRPAVKEQYLDACRTSCSPSRSARRRPASPGSASSPAEAEPGDGPRVMPGPDTIVIDDDGRPAAARRRRAAGPRRARAARLLQGPGEDRGAVHRGRRRALRAARRPGPDRGRRHDHPARPRQHLRQHRRGEGLPRGGRGGAQVPPRRLRRARHRRARRPARAAGRGADPAAGRTGRSTWRSWRRTCGGRSPATRCRAPCGSSTEIGRTSSGKADYALGPPVRRGAPRRRHWRPVRTDAVRPARHRAPDRRLHPVRARGGGDQPGRRARACSAACGSTTRPSWTPPSTGWTPTPTAGRTAWTW